MKTELEKLVDYIENSEASKDLIAFKAYHCILEIAKYHLKEESKQLTPTAVVQAKPEVCQNVIHHTCKWFDQYNGCMGCLVKKYEGKLSS